MDHIVVLEIRFDFNGADNVIYPVILQDENEMTLIDCGYPNFLPRIEAAAIEKGVKFDELTKVMITHHDFDHMGALAELKREYPHIEVLSSKADEKYISGKEKSLRLQQAEALYDTLPEEKKEYARGFQRLLESVENVKVDVCLQDGDFLPWCGGIEVVATPGHMPGHISIYHKASKTLIAGDALVVEKGQLAIANPQYTLDIEEAKKSISKLLNYEIERIICYHGGVFENHIKDALRQII